MKATKQVKSRQRPFPIGKPGIGHRLASYFYSISYCEKRVELVSFLRELIQTLKGRSGGLTVQQISICIQMCMK